MKKEQDRFVFTVDIGGTNTVIGLGKTSGKILRMRKLKTMVESGPAFLFTKINNILKSFVKEYNLKKSDIYFCSIGSPGPLDLRKGRIIYSVNLYGWEGFNLVSAVQSEFKIPVYIENDANLAGLGEAWKGAGKGKKVVLTFTIGTGVGGAVIINNKIFNGSHGYGAELGHITINETGPLCTCSNLGCLEEYVSARGIINRVYENGSGFQTSVLKGIEPEEMTPHKISLAAKSGDNFAKFILEETGRYLGIGLANYVNIFNPDVIVLGGGIMTENKIILRNARLEVKKRSFPIMEKDVKLVLSKLGDEANLIGAIKNGLNIITGGFEI